MLKNRAATRFGTGWAGGCGSLKIEQRSKTSQTATGIYQTWPRVPSGTVPDVRNLVRRILFLPPPALDYVGNNILAMRGPGLGRAGLSNFSSDSHRVGQRKHTVGWERLRMNILCKTGTHVTFTEGAFVNPIVL